MLEGVTCHLLVVDEGELEVNLIYNRSFYKKNQ